MKQHQQRAEVVKNAKARIKIATMGLCVTVLLTLLFTRMVPLTKADAPPLSNGEQRNLENSKVIVIKGEPIEEEERDLVETGTSTVPFFPRTLEFRDEEESAEKKEQYQLIGLGIRTVSFLGIQVYVVGMYIATDDIAALQKAMVKRVNPLASTLVAGEKGILKKDLLDPETSEQVWDHVLRDCGVRTVIRIVPTRNTDFGHLRDAFVRHITARSQGKDKADYQDDAFPAAVSDFKQLFSKGNIPKGRELLMARDVQGKLAVWFDDGKVGSQRLGEVKDERISRAVWMNYLAGKSVASESARQSIVQGMLEFVERPIGTVATQIV